MRYLTADASRGAGVAYHLVPETVWQNRDPAGYRSERFGEEGFIHLSNGLDEVLAAGNRHLKDDGRTYLVVAIRLDAVTSAVRYDDPSNVFPHIYGLLNDDAVVGSMRVDRGTDGTFTGVGADV